MNAGSGKSKNWEATAHLLPMCLAVHVDDKYMDEKGKFDLAIANPIVYSHGEYYGLGKKLGTFGYSIRKQRKKRQKK